MAFLYSLVLSMNRKFPLQSTKVIINQGVNAHQNVKKTKTAIFRPAKPSVLSHVISTTTTLSTLPVFKIERADAMN